MTEFWYSIYAANGGWTVQPFSQKSVSHHAVKEVSKFHFPSMESAVSYCRDGYTTNNTEMTIKRVSRNSYITEPRIARKF